MRKVFVIILSFFFNYCFSQTMVHIDSLIKINDLRYYNGKLFTGKCYANHASGALGLQGFFTDGKKDSTWTWWYENGTIMKQCIYYDGKKNGSSTFFYPNGKKKSEIQFVNDRNVKQELWDENGKKINKPSFQEFK